MKALPASTALKGFLLLLGSAAMAQDSVAPDAFVRAVLDDIVRIIEARHAELDGNLPEIYALVDAHLYPNFDLTTASRQIVGGMHWSEGAALQDHFVAAFYDYLVTSFGDLLIHFDEETFRIVSSELVLVQRDEQLATVATVLTLNDGTEVDVEFLMKRKDGGNWKVVDVSANNASYVGKYRAMFRLDIEKEGLGAPVAWLEAETARQRDLRGLE